MVDHIKLDSIESAIEDIKAGKMVVVVDDENRENEGDLICAAEKITSEMVNFMIREARGLLCVALTENRCKELSLGSMVDNNTAVHETAFTISVDYLKDGCTTGISAKDRSKTIQALVNPKTQPEELGRPGHIFPLKAKQGGVLRRTGHTEASIDLAKLAGLEPAGVLIEIIDEDGSMSRLPKLKKFADKFGLKLISIEDLIAYRLKSESLIKREIDIKLPTQFGNFELTAYRQINNNQLHLALSKGSWSIDESVLVRVHSSCVTGDIFGSCRCDCGPQLQAAMEKVEAEGTGIIVYMNQEGRGIGLLNKLKAYKLQEEGLDTAEANLKLGFEIDERDYGVGAQILRDMGVSKMRLMTNNPKKRAGLIGYGLEIIDVEPLEIAPNEHNLTYLSTKRDKMGHTILRNEIEKSH